MKFINTKLNGHEINMISDMVRLVRNWGPLSPNSGCRLFRKAHGPMVRTVHNHEADSTQRKHARVLIRFRTSFCWYRSQSLAACRAYCKTKN